MNLQYIATTQSGLEEILADELNLIGATEVSILNRAVSFVGNREILYAANMFCRTALHILKPIVRFVAKNEYELYDGVFQFQWHTILTIHKTFAIHHAVHSEYFTHSQYAALKTKDAIADYFRKHQNARPSVDTESPDIKLHLHIQNDQVTISLDSSGESLHRRGYRIYGHKAPINEVTAAGLILLSEWKHNEPLFDPMCGSGTLIIEAAMQAKNIAPCLIRNEYGFKKWDDFDAELFKKLFHQAEAQVIEKTFRISGSDIDKTNIEFALKNCENAKVLDSINLITKSFEESSKDFDQTTLIFNPPYGDRITTENIQLFYKTIGNKLKHDYSGCTAWILSGNHDATKSIGLRPSKRIKIFNGPIECRFLRFDLYDGSKKLKKV